MTTEAKQIYSDLVDKLKEDAEARRDSLTEATNFGADTADTLLIEALDKIHEAFDRQEINDEYLEKESVQNLSNDERRSLAVQSDFVAGFEKASTLRYRGRLRNLIYGAAREAGQAKPLGYIEFVLRQLPLTQDPNGS